MEKNVNLEWALFYQKLGWSIIPVQEKLSLVLWKKYQNEKATEEQIRQWWEQWPDADIGMVTGEITNRLVLDIDGQEGIDSIGALPIPHTPTVRTRNGRQYHFSYPKGCEAKTTIVALLRGVDTRGNGGYTKVPPSKCSDSSFYEWINGTNWETPLAEPPQWLIELLQKREKPVETQKEENKEPWIEEALQGAKEGDRHSTMLRLFGLYANAMPLSAAASHIRQWNKQNNPPIEDEKLDLQIKDLTKRFKKGEYTRTYEEPKERKIERISAAELVKKYSTPPKYLVPGLIPHGTRTIFAGWNGRGKSMAITDLAIEISRKKGNGLWLQKFPVEHGPVLYIDNENAKHLASHRLRQLVEAKNLTMEDLDFELIIGNHLKFTLTEDYEFLKQHIKEVKPILVIIDSFASTNTLDEDDSNAMRRFMDDYALPICEEFQCGMLFIDHENKGQAGVTVSPGKRTRGSGAKLDAADQGFSLDEKEGITIFQHSKRRYTKRYPDFPIEIIEANNGLIVRAIGNF